MATHTIQPEDWINFFDRFSIDHRGASATLEARGPELGDQVIAYEQVFRGISADEKDGENRIAIMIGALKDDSTTHAVMAPERVWLNDAEGASGEILEISCANDTTIRLSFEQQPLKG